MSLDVHLMLPGMGQAAEPVERIFVRREGATVEVTREEWDKMYPDRAFGPLLFHRDPVTVIAEDDENEVYWANITHNLNKMASEAGLYEPLWRPDENGIERAAQLIEPLRDGLTRLNEDRERLQQFNPENGWGTYDLLVSFTENYLAACERWPEAEVSVSR